MPKLGAHTLSGPTDNKCPMCVADGKQSKKCNYQVHLNSYGAAEMIVFKCPTHGEIKRLYSQRPMPVFQATYAEALTGERKGPPKKRKEI